MTNYYDFVDFNRDALLYLENILVGISSLKGTLQDGLMAIYDDDTSLSLKMSYYADASAGLKMLKLMINDFEEVKKK